MTSDDDDYEDLLREAAEAEPEVRPPPEEPYEEWEDFRSPSTRDEAVCDELCAEDESSFKPSRVVEIIPGQRKAYFFAQRYLTVFDENRGGVDLPYFDPAGWTDAELAERIGYLLWFT